MKDGYLKKPDIKLIKSLENKKFRKEHGIFAVEGDKMVREILNSGMTVLKVYAVGSWMEKCRPLFPSPEREFILVSDRELQQISFQKSPNQALAIVEIPRKAENIMMPDTGIILYLDNIQDPGNMGTIIRIADWFGIKQIACTPDSVDAYNPKVVQATMGAIARVRVTYLEPDILFDTASNLSVPVYGAFLEGENIYHSKLPGKSIIVMGNESKGISDSVAARINNRITIPSYPPGETSTESLNVAVATAVICAEFRRQAIERTLAAPCASHATPSVK